MATAHVPDEFFELIAHHLPPGQPVGSMGARHRVAVRAIWFVLATGNRWEDVPHEMAVRGVPPTGGFESGRKPGAGTGFTPTCFDSCGGPTNWVPTR
ncbi:Uncultured bacterium genome assembly Metasoil_fosmids_resub OS=uncultured bacterium PE=4 SV=1: DUF4096 [Gemmata massiliana]|uniref:Transposase n=1 Tax=Gemmata massiliana TaxID=1210884 RepID=A0A6P2CW20_9BACT|nr:transposase [Gemmata massiliana]VTR93093.1 Uncultured bacterium genome assembly Metasoil_fosmids_resub OS=uncultured bacterium PE=4 SV=1: DUF4096 [Gemmata massiliana]